MASTEKKTFGQQMRALHRDIGFVTAGLTLLFALSGIAQIFRDTNFLQREIHTPVQLEPGLTPEALAPALKMREVRVERTEGTVLYFRGGSYDGATGQADRIQKEWLFPFDRMTELHTSRSGMPIHWVTLAYGSMLLFMACSSFFMFKGGSPLQKRGLVLAAAGVIVALIALFLTPVG
ncbi:MAG: PepSY domain-containing protein [Candidatus Eisenbacteria bacterium]|uniref:PepSY domain-containing protein n=1 Tax=Eiseniibacteriota bacterium TaxID=2212470 RepID=A0A933W366_UNCEI|nr:PepSY domain-containing protein [Candidatus Eisenbacteria bacterium]